MGGAKGVGFTPSDSCNISHYAHCDNNSLLGSLSKHDVDGSEDVIFTFSVKLEKWSFHGADLPRT